MAGLFELIPLIGEAVAEAAPEVIETAPEIIETTSEAVPELADTVPEAAETASSTSSKVPVFDMTASGTRAGADAAFNSILNDAISFGKWAATEAAKQAAFYAGMKAAEAAFHALVASSGGASTTTTPDPATVALLAKVKQTTHAATALHSIVADWLSWSTTHYDERASYGDVTILDSSTSRYQILQFNLGALTDVLNKKAAPALLTFNTSKTDADLTALRLVLLDYAQQVSKQATSIANNEPAMVKDGLNAHVADAAQAVQKLS